MTHVAHNRGKGKTIAWLRAHVAHVGDDCLIWPFSRNEDGYGQFGHNGERMKKAHRWMCEAVHGPAPSPSHYAAHECGNGHGGCVHPKHLFWKTHAENTADFMRDGRARYGSHKHRKLSHAQVKILRNPPADKTLLQLSQEFGISYRHAKKIRQGISWKDGLPQMTGGRGVHEKLIDRSQPS